MNNLGLQFEYFTEPRELYFLGRQTLFAFFRHFNVPWGTNGWPSILEGCHNVDEIAERLAKSAGELPEKVLVAMKEIEEAAKVANEPYAAMCFPSAVKAYLRRAEALAQAVPQAEPGPTLREVAPVAVASPNMREVAPRELSVPDVAEGRAQTVSAPIVAEPQVKPGPQAVPAPNITEGAPIPALSAPQPESAPMVEAKAEPEPERSEEDKALERLARLSLTEYERVRCAEARALGIRVRILDIEVGRRRDELGLTPDAHQVKLQELEPWPEAMTDGPALLAEVVERFTRYVFLPAGAADALTLWSLHAHLFNAFPITPRLNLLSMKSQSGKTTCLDVISTLVPRMLRTEHLTSPVLFRVVDQRQPTLLLDEVDAYLLKDEELRGLLNAGHKSGACAYRCDGPGRAIRSFKAFGPAVLAGIGSLPDTLRDRSVLIPLTRAKKGQVAEKLNVNHVGPELGRKLARWAADNFAAVQGCNPTLAPGALNRSADNWRPLQAIAEVVGGGWGERAREAFVKLTSIPSAEQLEEQLLKDVRSIFAATGAERIFSSDLVRLLRGLPERSYGNANGEGLTERKLALALSRLIGVSPRTMRILGERRKGYVREEMD